jgi:hypothetical protein
MSQNRASLSGSRKGISVWTRGGSEIDLAKAEQELRDAQEKLAHPAPDADTEALLITYRNAMARVATAQQAKGINDPTRKIVRVVRPSAYAAGSRWS